MKREKPIFLSVIIAIISVLTSCPIVKRVKKQIPEMSDALADVKNGVRMPLTTLIGYLDAAHKGIVTGKDRDDYMLTVVTFA